MFLTGLIKFFIGLAGVILTLVFLFIAIFKRTKKGLIRKAGITLFSSVMIIIVISVVEYFIYPINQKTDQLLLTAYREAPLGGIWLALYHDKTWELGFSSREITATGTYQINADTLYLTAMDDTIIIGEIDKTSFIIGEKTLIEIQNSGIRSLEIIINNMN